MAYGYCVSSYPTCCPVHESISPRISYKWVSRPTRLYLPPIPPPIPSERICLTLYLQIFTRRLRNNHSLAHIAISISLVYTSKNTDLQMGRWVGQYAFKPKVKTSRYPNHYVQFSSSELLPKLQHKAGCQDRVHNAAESAKCNAIVGNLCMSEVD